MLVKHPKHVNFQFYEYVMMREVGLSAGLASGPQAPMLVSARVLVHRLLTSQTVPELTVRVFLRQRRKMMRREEGREGVEARAPLGRAVACSCWLEPVQGSFGEYWDVQ